MEGFSALVSDGFFRQSFAEYAGFLLELRVTDPTDTGCLSRGKQRLKNGGIWYTPQSGIWQTVWMECVPENYLRTLRITPRPEAGTVHFALAADVPENAGITVRKEGKTVAAGQTDAAGELTLTLPPEALRLWSPEDPFLYDVSIVLPGGESTVQGKLLHELGMFAPLQKKIAQGLPVLATCAGMILLAEKLTNDSKLHLATMPITVKRNAYGRQLGSFFTEAEFGKLGKVPMTFIRAPYIDEVGDGVEILAQVDGHIVAAREGNQLVTAFHPELDSDASIHQMLIDMAKAL